MNITQPITSDDGVITLSQIPSSGIDKQALFSLYELSLRQYIESTFGWDETFQRERFNASYLDRDFISINVGSISTGYLSLKDEAERVHLSLLLLQPEYRGRGIGQRVMHMLMARFSDSGRPLTLSCFLCNQGAIRFYRKLGLSIVSEDEHFVNYRIPAIC
ncbi:GNAT family N-acetyltransferase [Paraburkholderia bannensis]|uniref:GNAT family N-acetyltransferase n=1 Tax=Paraburkholderia bannensis TaxID=765414 RepID=UPI002ABE95E2|nr:GNAT family N-acetyltransferase [Paraburkholderia bannensis]